jgi:hypothetical protein
MSQNFFLGMKTEIIFSTLVFAVKFQSTQQRKCVNILGTYMLNWERKQMFILQALHHGIQQWQGFLSDVHIQQKQNEAAF